MMIKINNLIKEYKGKRVVDIQALDIPEGMVFGIVGGNGSGKSTLLKMIAELEEKTSGDIDKDISLSEMVYLFQKPHLFNTSVRKNIAYPLEFRKWDKKNIELRVDEMIEKFDLGHISHQNAMKLSGGEAQKVNLARALVFNPKWIFLDEPTANIDPKSTRQIESILKFLDINMILVTHNLNQASRLCDHVILMSEGKIIDSGQPEDVLNNKALLYV